MPQNIPPPPRAPEPPPVPRKTAKDALKELFSGAEKPTPEPTRDIPKLTKKPISKKTPIDIAKEFVLGADEPKEKYPLPSKKLEKESIKKEELPPYMLKGGYVAIDKLRWEVKKPRFHKIHPTSPQQREELIKELFGNTQIANPKNIELLRKKIDTKRQSTSWTDGDKRKKLEMGKNLFDELFPPKKRP